MPAFYDSAFFADHVLSNSTLFGSKSHKPFIYAIAELQKQCYILLKDF